MLWLKMIWTYLKDPKNLGLTILAVLVVALCIYMTGQYVALGVKDVKLAKQAQALETKDATIDALGIEISKLCIQKKALEETLYQIRIQLQKEQALRKKKEAIKTQIREDMTDVEMVKARNDIVDLYYSVFETDSDSTGTGNLSVAGETTTR